MKRTLAVAALLTAACGGPQQSVLNSGGPFAARIEGLWWFFFWLLGAIFAVVIGILLTALTRQHRGIGQEPLESTHRPSETTERRLSRIVAGGTGASIAILLALIVVSVLTGKSVSPQVPQKNSLVIEVTGNQWWWAVRYMNDDARRILATANEIHIPVGRPILIRGVSNDVIHSFWVPGLNGKRDLIPSRVTTEWLQADRPGRYRGQCAEFCGAQHAHMALWVIAEPPDRFEAWFAKQLEPAVTSSDDDKRSGLNAFLDNGCIFCHTIRGTRAAGQVGPDLTHFGSRLSIAAGTLPNTKGNLGGWIADPQNIKPGNHMATIPLRPEETEPLLDYLESLQ